MNTPKEQKRGNLLDLKVGAPPKVFLIENAQIEDCHIASLRYTVYEDGSRIIEIVGDSTGIKTTLHLRMVWIQNQDEIQEDEQSPYFPDHNFNYVQTYAAEARFAEQFVRLNRLRTDWYVSHD